MELFDLLLTLLGKSPPRPGEALRPASLPERPSPAQQSLFPLLYHETKRRGLSPIPAALEKAHYASARRAAILGDKAEGIVRALKGCGVPCLEIKGQDMERRFYPAFGTRPQADIDVLIGRRDMPRVMKILPSRGFDFFIGDERASIFVSDGVHFDVHQELFGYRLRVIMGHDFEPAKVLSAGAIPDVLYFVVSCMEYVTHGGERLIPAVDLHLISGVVKPGILAAYLNYHPGALPGVLFAHHDMVNRFGYSPLPLPDLHLTKRLSRLSEKTARFTRKPRISQRRLLFLLRHSGAFASGLRRILFPPRRIVSAASCAPSRAGYLKRMASRLIRAVSGSRKSA